MKAVKIYFNFMMFIQKIKYLSDQKYK